MKFLKKIRPISIFSVVVAIGFVGAFYALAQTVIDSFDNDDKITNAWRISTSTPGEIKLADKFCDDSTYFCSASTTCAGDLGDGDNIIVARTDAPTAKQWKIDNTSCSQPQCSVDGYQNTDNLVAQNYVDFSDYPARDYCKSLGGRLPTTGEFSCIYNNKTSFGDNFQIYYWSSREADGSTSDYAYIYRLDNNTYYDYTSISEYGVRCVIGW